MIMRHYAELQAMELRDSSSLNDDQRRFVLSLEKEAGLILKGR